MDSWLIYILLATISGSLSVVLAKAGLRESSEHIGLFVRTGILFLTTFLVSLNSGNLKEIVNINRGSLLVLIAAGITTSTYWILYYKALKLADASHVAAIDKAGIIITVLFSIVILKEPITLKTALGIALIVAGCFLIVAENKY